MRTSVGERILISIALGSLLTVILLILGGNVQNAQISSILLWNAHVVAGMAGQGPSLGNDAHGSPMHEGSPVIVFLWIFGILSGFVIYPVLIFIALTVWNRKKSIDS